MVAVLLTRVTSRGTVGFARFCTAEYSSDAQDMDNAYMHLTNVAIQKHGALSACACLNDFVNS